MTRPALILFLALYGTSCAAFGAWGQMQRQPPYAVQVVDDGCLPRTHMQRAIPE